ncbi:glycerate kinase [Labilibaculum filiforme]|uniref:Glycerate kinase n=1 Tax=Labilibaculum filiforme TaxID=1940526 RepID=A0A2N3HXR7_9BACT|nr:glycerate kinase [Labilibaculum filiforme]PKQ62849.1 glycerate kinase [Labilibaculum filiforme]
MKKIILAPDKFKGSLSGMQFCEAVERGIRKHTSDIEIIQLPLADGGDGTIEVLNFYLEGEILSVKVHDPLHRKIKASYLYSAGKKTAYIEMAAASGICLLNGDEANPMLTSTYGTGELIIDALNRGVKHIILGIGGSATNDAGLGMARALGYSFFDKDNGELKGLGEDLIRLNFIDNSAVHPKLKEVKFELACDVDNPLYGENGAAYIYSPQKGATPKMVLELDAGLQNFNEVVQKQFEVDLQGISGAGAAGGLGAGCILFLNAVLNSGIDLIKKEAKFDTNIKGADWIITGEGKLDEQTFSGKVIRGVLDSITDQKLAIFCGLIDLKPDRIKELKIEHIAEVSSYASGIEDSIKNAGVYLEIAAEAFAKTYL